MKEKLNVNEHEDIFFIEKLSDTDTSNFEKYRDKHVFLRKTQKLIQNKFDLIYFILTKQLKKGHNRKEKIFMTDYEDKCVNLEDENCTEKFLFVI